MTEQQTPDDAAVPAHPGAAAALPRPARPGARGRGRRAWSTRRSAWAGTPRASCGRSRTCGSSASTATRRRSSSRAAGSRRSATGSPACTPSTTRSTTCSTGSASRRSRACSWTSASRRCSSTRASAASPTRPDAPLDMRMDATTGPDGRRRAQHLRRARARADPAGVRRGAVRAAHRPRRSSPQRARRPLERTGELVEHRARQHPGRDPQDRRQPGQAHVPGAADRGERRDRGARARAAAVDRGARGRRPDRRRVVPVARGPRRQAGARRRRHVQRAARPARRARDARAVPAPGDARRRGGRRGRARAQPALAVRPAARRRAHPSHPRPPAATSRPEGGQHERPVRCPRNRLPGARPARAPAACTRTPTARRPRTGAGPHARAVHPRLHGRPRRRAAVRAAAQHADGGDRVRASTTCPTSWAGSTRTQQDLPRSSTRKASPTQLAAAAAALGMVPTNGTGWLRLSDGSVQGAPEPAGAGG